MIIKNFFLNQQYEKVTGSNVRSGILLTMTGRWEVYILSEFKVCVIEKLNCELILFKFKLFKNECVLLQIEWYAESYNIEMESFMCKRPHFICI